MPDGIDTPTPKDTIQQFAQRLRTRYPGAYDDKPDSDLVDRYLRKNPVYADRVDTPPDFRLLRTSTGYPKIDDLYEQAGRRHNVDPNLLLEQGRQETINFKPEVMYGGQASPKGAVGAGQFMPATAPKYGLKVNDAVDERHDPVKSVDAQARYMRKLLDQFHDDEGLALAGYNAGEYRPTTLGRGIIPKIPETQKYVSTISDALSRIRSKPGLLQPPPTAVPAPLNPDNVPFTSGANEPETDQPEPGAELAQRPRIAAPDQVTAPQADPAASLKAQKADLSTLLVRAETPGERQQIETSIAKIDKSIADLKQPGSTPNVYPSIPTAEPAPTDFKAEVSHLTPVPPPEHLGDTNNLLPNDTAPPVQQPVPTQAPSAGGRPVTPAPTPPAAPQAPEQPQTAASAPADDSGTVSVSLDPNDFQTGGENVADLARQRAQYDAQQNAPIAVKDPLKGAAGTFPVDITDTPSDKEIFRRAMMNVAAQHGKSAADVDKFIEQRNGAYLQGEPYTPDELKAIQKAGHSTINATVDNATANEFLKSTGESGTIAPSLAGDIAQKDVQYRAEGGQPDLGALPYDFGKEDADAINKFADEHPVLFGALGRSAVPALTGSLVGGLGDIGGIAAGLINKSNEYSPTMNSIEEILSNGGSRKVKVLDPTIEDYKKFYEGTSAFRTQTGTKTADGGDTLPTAVFKGLGSVPKIILVTALPGGMMGGFAIEGAALKGLQDGSLGDMFVGGAQGGIQGAFFHYLPKGMDRILGVAGDSVLKNVARVGTEVATITGGNYAIGATFGDKPEENLINSLALGIMHLSFAMPKALDGKTVHAIDPSTESEIYVKVDGDKLVAAKPGKADYEMVLPPDAAANKAKYFARDAQVASEVQAQERKANVEVPETPPEPEAGGYTSVLDEIRQKDARTKAQIQNVFPHLSREQAADLGRQAWGDEWGGTENKRAAQATTEPENPASPTAIAAGVRQEGIAPETDRQSAVQNNAAAPAESGTVAAHEAATSPTNDLPQPTEAQIEAGNYRKGHLKINGLDISVENPVGSKREGVDKDGKPWSNQMQHHYGYIRGSIGADKEHIDLFVKDHTPADFSGPVYVVDQMDPATGKFDEHKAMLGFDSEDEARKAYAANYAKDWKGLGSVTAMPFDKFKTWATDAARRKPVAEHPENVGAEVPPTTENRDKVDANERPARTIQPTADEAGRSVPESRPPAGRTAQGKETEIRIPDSETAYKANYAIRELDDVIPSHNPHNFQPNEKYYFTNDRHYDKEAQYQEQVRTRSKGDKFDASQLVNNNPTSETGPPIIDRDGNVLGGNSRSMILHRIYKDADEGTSYAAASRYRKQLMEDAAIYGVDPRELSEFKHPVLVREINDKSIEAQTAITELNKSSTTALTSSEQAVAEGRRMSHEALDYVSGKIESTGPDATLNDALSLHGPDIVNRLVEDGIFSGGERNKLLADGKITPDGKARIERILTGQVFDDVDQLSFAPPYVKKNMERAIASLVKTQGDKDWNIIPETREAIDLLTEQKAKGSKQTLEEYAQTPSMAHGDWSQAAIDIAHTLQKGPNAVSRAFKTYAGEYANAKSGGGLFGASTQPEAFRTAFGEGREAQPAAGLFANKNEQQKRDTESGKIPATDAKPTVTKDIETAKTEAKTTQYGKSNTVFTESAAEKAREILRKKLGGTQLNTGLDPELMQAGITLAGYHVEAGARQFAEFANAMIDDLGEGVRPYLKSWYMGVKYHPDITSLGMDGEKEIDHWLEHGQKQLDQPDEASPGAKRGGPAAPITPDDKGWSKMMAEKYPGYKTVEDLFTGDKHLSDLLAANDSFIVPREKTAPIEAELERLREEKKMVPGGKGKRDRLKAVQDQIDAKNEELGKILSEAEGDYTQWTDELWDKVTDVARSIGVEPEEEGDWGTLYDTMLYLTDGRYMDQDWGKRSVRQYTEDIIRSFVMPDVEPPSKSVSPFDTPEKREIEHRQYLKAYAQDPQAFVDTKPDPRIDLDEGAVLELANMTSEERDRVHNVEDFLSDGEVAPLIQKIEETGKAEPEQLQDIKDQGDLYGLKPDTIENIANEVATAGPDEVENAPAETSGSIYQRSPDGDKGREAALGQERDLATAQGPHSGAKDREAEPAPTDGAGNEDQAVKEAPERPPVPLKLGDRVRNGGLRGTVFKDKQGNLRIERSTGQIHPLTEAWSKTPEQIRADKQSAKEALRSFTNPDKLAPGDTASYEGKFGKVYVRGGQLRVKYEVDGKIKSDRLSDAWSKATNPESGAASTDLLTLGVSKFIKEDVTPGVKEVAKTVAGSVDDVRRLVFAGGRGDIAKLGGGILRSELARAARSYDIAEHALREARDYFARTPIDDNYDFIAKIEEGDIASLPPDEQPIATSLRSLLDQGRDDVQALGKGKLQQFNENYFPHIWKDPTKASQVFARMFGRRPFEGSKSFLKARTHQTFADGLNAGLEPISDNPVDLTLLKIKEMQRYVAAHRTLNQLKESGLATFVKIGDKAPDGFIRINDKISDVYAPPTMYVKEYVDKVLYEGMSKLAEDLGIEHERKMSAGAGRIGYSEQGGDRVVTQYATGERVLAHEIGHQLDYKYDLIDRFLNNPDKKLRPELKRELRALADAKQASYSNPEGYRTPYTRKRVEQMAHILESYVNNPEQLREIAPNVKRVFEQVIDENPELQPILKLQRSLGKEQLVQEMSRGGLVKLGNYYAAEPAATILNNHLSPGLRDRSDAFKAWMLAGNTLNQFQLGFSAFHLGFTSVDAMVSKFALGLNQLTSGRPVQAARSMIESPLAPVANLLRGRKVIEEWKTPNSTDPVTQAMANLAVEAGARVKMDDFYKTNVARKMVDSFKRGNILGGIVRLPFGITDAVSKPILEYIVPRQKLGIFADLARHEVERLGPDATPEQTREAVGRLWDSVDNRMGQMVYDNLFWNRTAKDLAMASVRSVGWNLGTYRELGGAAKDTLTVPLRIREHMQGDKTTPIFTERMAYAAALPVVVGTLGATIQYLYTGQGPQDLKDYFFPRTGNLDENGKPERLSLPSYIKDLYAYYNHPVRTLGHKTQPLISLIDEMLVNEDFLGNKIRNEDDPVVQQLIDAAKHVGTAATPMAIQGLQKERKRGGTPTSQFLPFIGLTPAPSDIEKSPAQEVLSELKGERLPAEARTKEEAQRSQTRQELTREVKLGRNIDEEFKKAVAAGILSQKDWNTIQERGRSDYLANGVKGLPLSDALKVYDAATEDERNQLREVIQKKIVGVQNPISDADKDKIQKYGFTIPLLRRQTRSRTVHPWPAAPQ